MMDKKQRTTQINWDKNGVPHRQKAPQPRAVISTPEDDEIAQLRAEIAAEEEQIRAQEIEQLRAEIEAEEAQLNAPKDISRPPVEAAIRQAKRIGRAGLTGIAGLADIPNLAAMGAYAVGLKDTPTFYEPVSGRVQGYIDEKTGGELRPENKAEEWADTLIEGAAPLAAGVLTGGASLTSLAAKNAAKLVGGGAKKGLETVAKFGSKTYKPTSLNVSGSLGSSAAVKGYQDNVDDPSMLGSLAAGFAGGLGGASAANYKNMAAKAAGKITRFDPAKYKQYSENNIPVSLSNTAKGTVPAKLENIASKTLGLEGSFKKHYRNQEKAIANNLGASRIEDIAPDLSIAKKGAEGYHKRSSDIYGKRKDKFKGVEERSIINEDRIDASNLIRNLEKEKDLALTPTAIHDFNKSGNGQLLHKLKKYTSEQQDVVIPNARQKGIGYSDFDRLRKNALNESKKAKREIGAGTPETIEAQKRYKDISDVGSEFIESKGSALEVHNSKEAREFWARYKNENGGMNAYVKKVTKSDTPEDAFAKLKTDGGYWNVVKQGIPKNEKPKLFQTFVEDLGQKGGHFDINKFQRRFSDLPESVKKESIKTLPTKKARDTFKETLKLVDENKRMMAGIANTSNTAHTQSNMKYLTKGAQLAGAAATGKFAGVPAAITFGIIAKAGSAAWVNQNFLKRVNETMTATTPQQVESALKALSRTANQVGRQTKEHTQKKPIIDIGKGKYVK